MSFRLSSSTFRYVPQKVGKPERLKISPLDEEPLPVRIKVLAVNERLKISSHAADRSPQFMSYVVRHVMFHPPVLNLLIFHFCQSLFHHFVILQHCKTDGNEDGEQENHGNEKVEGVGTKEVLDIQLIRKGNPDDVIAIGLRKIAVIAIVRP